MFPGPPEVWVSQQCQQGKLRGAQWSYHCSDGARGGRLHVSAILCAACLTHPHEVHVVRFSLQSCVTHHSGPDRGQVLRFPEGP